MELGLRGKRAVVAAASKGLGFAIADSLAAEGCAISICSRDEDRINDAANRIREAHGAEVHASVVDIAEGDQITEWIDASAHRWGGIDLVVANGGGPRAASFGELDQDDWDRSYQLVLRSALTIATAAKPHLGPGASVLYNTSVSVREPLRALALSTVFRAGVTALSKLLADEWARDGIRVNHLIPGRILTDRVIDLDGYLADVRGVSVEDVQAAYSESIPLGRYGSPDEYAAAAVFLLSDAASYITGASLQVDGGVLRAI
ncbi:MAG: SDR family oxidoreductase [Acidimicrobiia bacterium]